MDLRAPVDIYCERLGPGLFAEPLNAISNAGFLLAALLLLAHWRGREDVPWYARVLARMIFLIGLGSLSFHTFANQGTEILDVLFIALYIHFFVVCFFHHFLPLPWRYAWLAAPGFRLFGKLVTWPFAPGALNGSVDYLPALAGLLLMALYLWARRQPAARWLGGAAAIFLVSLALRTGDRAWCASLPIGTHWLWHCLNAATLALVSLSLTQDRRAQASGGAPT